MQTDEWGRLILGPDKIWTGNGANGCYDPMGDEIKHLRRMNKSLNSDIEHVYDRLQESHEILIGLIKACTQEFNEKGASGYALARLTDAHNLLPHWNEESASSVKSK